jgi:YHS domain-containing protein
MRQTRYLITWLLLIVVQTALAAEAPVYSSFLGGAIRGYDPVAYFTQSKPVEGSSRYQLEYMGAVWKFASAENKVAFEAMPERYAPQYGGYCAYAVSRGYTASIDPEAWTIVDGKLYLNYSKSVRATWSQDIPGNIAKADSNWPAVLGR